MKKEERLQKEKEYLEKLKKFDLDITNDKILGIDEVGRGPIAGPLVVCGIIMKKDSNILGVKDSKKVTEKNRIKLNKEILEDAEYVCIKEIDVNTIDELNILNATKKAMQEIIYEFEEKSTVCLVDAVKGLRAKNSEYNILSIIKGDDTSYSIACASIVAKVYRDNLMEKYEEEFPEYGFSKHKGYGTKAHYDAILKNGITKIHRKSFLKNLEEHRK